MKPRAVAARKGNASLPNAARLGVFASPPVAQPEITPPADDSCPARLALPWSTLRLRRAVGQQKVSPGFRSVGNYYPQRRASSYRRGAQLPCKSTGPQRDRSEKQLKALTCSHGCVRPSNSPDTSSRGQKRAMTASPCSPPPQDPAPCSHWGHLHARGWTTEQAGKEPKAGRGDAAPSPASSDPLRLAEEARDTRICLVCPSPRASPLFPPSALTCRALTVK